jgi:hypothetical protein
MSGVDGRVAGWAKEQVRWNNRRSIRETLMNDKQTKWETFTSESAAILDRLRDLIHEGNVRRVVVEHQGRTVAEFPLTAGVVGAVFAPVLAAIGALLALLQNCTIRVERAQDATDNPAPGRTDETPAGVV